MPKILNKHLLTFGGSFAIVKMCLNKNKNAQNKNKNQKTGVKIGTLESSVTWRSNSLFLAINYT